MVLETAIKKECGDVAGRSDQKLPASGMMLSQIKIRSVVINSIQN